MIMKLQGVLNARELSGLKTTAGRTIKENLLLRSGDLHKATQEDQNTLSALGLRHIVDFRDPAEVSERPDASIPGADYLNLQALPSLPPSALYERGKDTAPGPEEIFPAVYTMLGSCAEAKVAYRAFFRVLLAGDGAVLWHCRQGKDRTGVATMLLLTALGVAYETALKDYLATNDCMEPILKAELEKNDDPERRQILSSLLFVRADWLRLCLDEMEKAYGGTEGYLRNALGLCDSDFARLRTLYTE